LFARAFAANEMIDSPQYKDDKKTIMRIVENLRHIGEKALELDGRRSLRSRYLKKILQAFRKMSSHKNKTVSDSVSLSEELQRLFDCQAKKSESQLFEFVSFLANEAVPLDFLRALSSWDRLQSVEPVIFDTIQTALKRSARLSMGKELSGSLLRVRQAKFFVEAKEDEELARVDNARTTTTMHTTLWNRLSQGMLVIAK
jgi:hypothetical protein